VLRELLDNAFNHGSRNRPDGIVQADCLVTDNYARCVVYDNGPGFDYPAQLKREEEGHLKAGTRGRGLLLVARAVDRIEVDTSKGSRFEVVLYKQSVDVAVRRKIPERGSSEISDSSVSTVNPLPRGIVVVTVNGYLDSHSFEEVEETINDLFRKHFYKVVVDLSHVEYISSSGAGVFIGALSEAQEHDGNIVLVNPTNSVSEVLDLLGLRQIFNVCRSVEEAQEFFT
jgi:anti-anti-sigma factor